MLLELFGANAFIDYGDFSRLVMRLALDLLMMFLVVRAIYFPIYKRRDYVFTYFLFNIITFFVCHLLRKVPIELGFALGLFAVFGILRYRTEAIRIRDLTYMFVVIGLGILNAVSNKKISVVELLFTNATIGAAIFILESVSFGGHEEERVIVYDNLALLKPDRKQELLDDLRARTGLDVHSVIVGQLDFLRDTAHLTILYDRNSKSPRI